MYRCAGAEVWRTNIKIQSVIQPFAFTMPKIAFSQTTITDIIYYFYPIFESFIFSFQFLRSCQSRTEILKTLHRKKFCDCTCTMNKREAKSIPFCQARLPLCKNVFTQRTFAFKKGSCVPPCNASTGIDFWLLQILTANNKRRTV